MDLRFVKRLALIVMALFPALWGLLGDLNNATDFKGTATNAVAPMIAMTNTYGNPLQIWRAITAPWAAEAGLALIMAAETAAGVFGAVGIIVMIASLRGSAAAFARGKAWMILSCLFAISGLGRRVHGGRGGLVPRLAGEAGSAFDPARRPDLFSALRARPDRCDDPLGRALVAGGFGPGSSGGLRPNLLESRQRPGAGRCVIDDRAG